MDITNKLQVDILKQLTETELLEMSDAMLEVAYENGDVVCRQGDMGLHPEP